MTQQDLTEELDAIEAIYPGAVEQNGSLYVLEIPDYAITLNLTFPSNYPSEPPHVLSVIQGPDETEIDKIIKEVFVEDQVCLFDFIEAIREKFPDHSVENQQKQLEEQEQLNVESSKQTLSKEEISKKISEKWVASAPIIDRKSVFIGYACKTPVPCIMDDISDNYHLLMEDNHIQRATHNIKAYVAEGPNHVPLKGYDEDGETAAGGRLQHLLEVRYKIIAFLLFFHKKGHSQKISINIYIVDWSTKRMRLRFKMVWWYSIRA